MIDTAARGPGIEPGPRAVVLVEGRSDRAALEALAVRRGRDLPAEGVHVVPMGGATSIERFLDRYADPAEIDRVAVLCDAREEHRVRRGLRRVEPVGAAAPGCFVCVADLEDELIRGLGADAVERVIAARGELRSFRVLQRQPAQQGRPREAQLRRFLGSRGGRKIHYAPLLVDALDLDRVPPPLDGALSHVDCRALPPP